MTLGEWLPHAEGRLRAAGIESARMEAQLLAGHVLRVDRAWLLAHPEHEFPDLAGELLLQRRERREPLAYLLGYRDFYGRTFTVDETVLIPRHETETLIEAALTIPEDQVRTVLDLGTGSGILAVTLAMERPRWEVTAVDVSPEALATASANARFHGASVRFVLSDGFSALLGESFDLIVTNPPYIGRGEPLEPEVAEHEPELALFSGETGYEFYDRLAKEAPDYLAPEGAILMEVGHTQAEEVQRRFVETGWTPIHIWPDLSGVPRVVGMRWLEL